jgi:hypothetical protein
MMMQLVSGRLYKLSILVASDMRMRRMPLTRWQINFISGAMEVADRLKSTVLIRRRGEHR